MQLASLRERSIDRTSRENRETAQNISPEKKEMVNFQSGGPGVSIIMLSSKTLESVDDPRYLQHCSLVVVNGE